MRRATRWTAAVLALSAFSVAAADFSALLKQLGSEQAAERTAAIAELRKLGTTVREQLQKSESTETMSPQQMLLVRRLQGELLIEQNSLPAVDLAGLVPFGEDKEKNRAGDPNLLFNKDKKLIAMKGDFALEQGPLEFLVVSRGPNARLHETIVALHVRPRDICWALLACAYTYAGELSEDGQVNLPKDAGVMISVQFLWEPPHAFSDPGLELGSMIAAFKQKHAILMLGKQAAEARAQMLLDMEGDLITIRNLGDHDVLNDDTQALIAKSPFTDETRKETCVYEDAQRQALVDALDEYVKKQPKLAAAVAKPMELPEKKLMRVPIECFAWNMQTSSIMKRSPFAFTGSKFEKDPDTNKMQFMADLEKSIVAVKLDPYAILNTPLDTRAIDPQHAAGYGVNRYVVPKRGARCWLVFEPWNGATLTAADLKDTGNKNVPPAPPPQQ
ncbi:MAG TPA: YdjY domain-containing protein [Planctomycetota bacterium]|jgi:hypothetical protein